jgi:hypothetical protein
MIKIIKNIQALSTFKQNRLSQKLSKLSVALADLFIPEVAEIVFSVFNIFNNIFGNFPL